MSDKQTASRKDVCYVKSLNPLVVVDCETGEEYHPKTAVIRTVNMIGWHGVLKDGIWYPDA